MRPLRNSLAVLIGSVFLLAMSNGGSSAGNNRVVAPLPGAAVPYMSNQIVISSFDDLKYLPAVAYNPVHNEYLVVWHNKGSGNREILAQRVSDEGKLLNSFTIATGSITSPNDRAQPSVAYDRFYDRYLVVYIYDYPGDGSDWDVRGRFIPWEGPSASLEEFAIIKWPNSQWNPKVAFSNGGEYLVTWTNTSPGLPAYVSAANLDSGSGSVLGSVTISSGTEDRINPDVAYNLSRDEYLVVWEKVGSQSDIHGMRLEGDGSLLGSEFAIAGWPDSEKSPSVAACWQADQYLVGWQSLVNPPTDYDVFARYIGGDGSPGGVYRVDGTTLPEIAVDISCNTGGNQYMIAYQSLYTDAYYGISGRMAFPTETMGNAFALVESGYSADRTNPAIDGGSSNFFVAWEHMRDGTVYQDIHGMLVWPNVLFLPLIRR
jgi:hypothetical protein